MKENWLIYGATGYTGRLIAQEAVRRGHRPILAGRSAQSLSHMATDLGLDSIVIPLNNLDLLSQIVADFQIVFHAAGPFVETSEPMVQACLRGRTHYLDITGEISVLEHNLALDSAAKAAGIGIISGAGFDVVPTDCLIGHIASKIPDADHLEVAIAGVSRSSGGTAKSSLGQGAKNMLVRNAGKLTPIPFGFGGKWIHFLNGDHFAIPVSWGDLVTAYHATRIENITAYLSVPVEIAAQMRRFGPSIQGILENQSIRAGLKKLAGSFVQGPDENLRQNGRSQVWARAWNPKGDVVEACLETQEAYQFTAVAAVRCVEKILARSEFSGSFTPAQAFGSDFILEIPNTVRVDR